MFWICFFGCQQEQKYDELAKRLSQLEEQVAQHTEELQQCNRTEEKTQKNPICTQVQPDAYVVSRHRLETILESVELRPKVYPHQKNGDIIGLRIAHVPEDWTSCDFEDGDLLVAINEVQLRNPRVLSNLYDRKDYMEHIEVRRKRKDKESTLRITIQDREIK